MSTMLEAELLAHLDAQLASARRLLDLVLRQGQAIRRQDVESVVARIAEIQGEMERRGGLEGDRTRLLEQAGRALGLPGHAVTLDALGSLMGPAEAQGVRERSAELRGLLGEIQREHGTNRSLMRQELSFLDHLTRLLGGGADTGYRPPSEAGPATPPAPSVPRTLDLQA